MPSTRHLSALPGKPPATQGGTSSLRMSCVTLPSRSRSRPLLWTCYERSSELPHPRRVEAGEGIEYVAEHLGHRNIRNTRVDAQITNPARDQVFRALEPHPK